VLQKLNVVMMKSGVKNLGKIVQLRLMREKIFKTCEDDIKCEAKLQCENGKTIQSQAYSPCSVSFSENSYVFCRGWNGLGSKTGCSEAISHQ